MLYYCLSDNKDYLDSILELGKQNLKVRLSKEETKVEGFITVQYTEEELQLMANIHKQAIAIDQTTKKVAAYALLLDRVLEKNISYLVSMFDLVNNLSFQGKTLLHERYIVMGQICVAKEYRGQGVFRKLYNTFSDYARDSFDYVITEVHAENTRSLRAHYQYGFVSLYEFESADGNSWVIVILPLSSRPST